MTTNLKSHTIRSESGFAAILVTMVMMIVISLIVLGFAQISRREQRSSLDRQLSTQAFYAAETGVNDAATFVAANATQIGTTAKTDCAIPGTNPAYSAMSAAASVLDSTTGVAYTCLLIDPAPTTLQYSDVSDSSIVIPFEAVGGTAIDHITLTWQQAPNQTATTTGCPTSVSGNILRQPSAWTNCTFGLARVDLTPTAAPIDRTTLSQKTMSGFFVPVAGGSGNTPYKSNDANTDALYAANCTGGTCSETISNLGGTQYQMRVRFVYQSTALLQVAAFDNSGSNKPLRVADAQTLIDATGKASDVLRRIQVRVPTFKATPGATPDYALQTTDSICKQFSIAPGADIGNGAGIPFRGQDAASVVNDHDCSTFGY